jgi:hypothetical protein
MSTSRVLAATASAGVGGGQGPDGGRGLTPAGPILPIAT